MAARVVTVKAPPIGGVKEALIMTEQRLDDLRQAFAASNHWILIFDKTSQSLLHRIREDHYTEIQRLGFSTDSVLRGWTVYAITWQEIPYHIASARKSRMTSEQLSEKIGNDVTPETLADSNLISLIQIPAWDLVDYFFPESEE